jgi:rhodanese-related sulfurtransferase
MKILNIFGLAVMACMMSTCRSKVITSLEAGSFEETLRQTPHAQLVDVRTPQEYAEGHLAGSVLMNIRESSFESLIRQLDKERPVFVYCRAGKRSLDAARILEKNKFKLVYNLEGGIIAWKNKGKPVAQ